jgi:hypothetical protein
MLRALQTARLLSYRRILVISSVSQPLAHRKSSITVATSPPYDVHIQHRPKHRRAFYRPQRTTTHPVSCPLTTVFPVATSSSTPPTASKNSCAQPDTASGALPYTAAPTATTPRGRRASIVCARPFESRWNFTTRWSCWTRTASE